MKSIKSDWIDEKEAKIKSMQKVARPSDEKVFQTRDNIYLVALVGRLENNQGIDRHRLASG